MTTIYKILAKFYAIIGMNEKAMDYDYKINPQIWE